MPEPAPNGTTARRARWLRTAGVLLKFGLRADRRLVLAFFALAAIWQVASLVLVYATKLIVDAALVSDVRGVTVAGLAYGFCSLIQTQCSKTYLWIMFRLNEKTGHVVDRELMEIVSVDSQVSSITRTRATWTRLASSGARPGC
jgi:hypothetical protein